MNWEKMFNDLLDDVEQIPHPMAERVWDFWTKEISDEEGDE